MELSKSVIGLELGTTRIKAVLLDEERHVVASGSREWENHYVNGIFTYPIEEIHETMRSCYLALKRDVQEKTGETLRTVAAIGISAMMHGYLPLDEGGKPLCEFRTWRNNVSPQAAETLTELFSYNIPQRWGIAHLYQAILNEEEHLPRIHDLTSLPVYAAKQLTGEAVVGLGEASGLFPVDFATGEYNRRMAAAFDEFVAGKRFPWKVLDILPRIVKVGEIAGKLTKEGARFLDPEGDLQPGIPIAPPEGDADTGLVATNTIRPRTGNVSAGTSVFTLLVLDRPLRDPKKWCVLSTPDGHPAIMAHGSTCTSDINAWVNLFAEYSEVSGHPIPKEEIFPILFREAMKGDPDCGGLLSYNYHSGEPVTGIPSGRPLFVRTENAGFSLANFMRTHIFSAFSTMEIGIERLKEEENVSIDSLVAHGGIFKTPGVATRLLSAVTGAQISVYPTAGEGGAFGMALLASYMLRDDRSETLPDFLDRVAFSDVETISVKATEEEIEGYRRFLALYRKGLPIEKTAVEQL